MKTTLALAFLGLSVQLCAQSAERSVIGSAGSHATVGSVAVSYTVGEAVIATHTGATLVLTQGFQQNDPVELNIAEESLGFNATLYPNPTRNGVTLALNSAQPLQIRLDVYDLSGRSVPIPQPEFTLIGVMNRQLDFSGLAAGTYLVHMTDASGVLNQTVRVQKVN